MRERLAEYVGQQLHFTATVNYFSETIGKIRTVLLKDVKLNDELITDHLWVKGGRWSKGLRSGDRIRFRSQVSTYTKEGNRHDYSLHPPTHKPELLERR